MEIDRSKSQDSLTQQEGSDPSVLDNPVFRALDILEDSFHVDAPNRSFESALKNTSKNDFLRLICIYRYLKMLQKKLPQVRSSEEIALSIYPNMTKKEEGEISEFGLHFF